MSDTFRFAPSILARLGEELVPNPDQGLIELVKNSYDADASTCEIELIDITTTGGSIRIIDDGLGMSESDIRNGWLVLGKSGKDQTLTSRGRLPVGEKGLGRLAALRLGRSAVLKTRPESEPGVQYTVKFDWDEFDRAAVVEEVPIEIQPGTTDLPPGTSIEISDLRASLGRMDTKRLARALLLLSDPFASDSGFRPTLISKEFVDLELLVSDSYFGEADFHLIAHLDDNGHATAQVVDYRGEPLWHEAPVELNPGQTYRAPKARFDLYHFNLSGKAFTAKSVTLGEVRDWLEVVGGVHLYHRNIRVRPYGDPGHDWLELNLRRVRSPELRPSTNNSIGSVIVEDPDEELQQKTDRSGFIENRGFSELRDFAMDAVDWMAVMRLKEREKRREESKRETAKKKESAKSKVDKAVAGLPDKQRKPLETAINRLERAREKEVGSLRDELQLYRTLSTVGTTVAVFAHETASPLERMENQTRTIARRAKALAPDQYDAKLARPIGLLERAITALRSYTLLPLRLLQRDKRRLGAIKIHETIESVLDTFGPFLDDAQITVKTEFIDTDLRVTGRPASLESILANLLTNAVVALKSPDRPRRAREIRVSTALSGDQALIRVADTGPGIRDIDPDEIWLPGRTTKTDGTGIGLTIVMDEVADLGGHIRLDQDDSEETAFIVELPVMKDV